MATLGVSDRFRAAEVLRKREGREDYEAFVYEPFGVASGRDDDSEWPSEAAKFWHEGPGRDYLRDSIGWPDTALEPSATWLPYEQGSTRNDLSPGRRLQLIAGIYVRDHRWVGAAAGDDRQPAPHPDEAAGATHGHALIGFLEP